MAHRKITPDLLHQRVLEAAVTALERLMDVLSSPDSSNADVLKAATLILDKMQKSGDAGAPSGDWEITVKED